MKPLSALSLIILFFTACNNQNPSGENIADEPKKDTVNYQSVITETNKAFSSAALKGDSAAFVTTLYHPDAAIYPPNMPATDSKTAGSFLRQFPKMGITAFTLDTKEVYEGNETVTEVGTYEMRDDSKTIDKGKYIVVWKKDGDTWKLYRDIWNSDNPPAPAPSSRKK